MLRFIIIIFYVVTFLIIFIPILLVEWIIGLINKDAKGRLSLFLVRNGFRLCLWTAGAKVIVVGEANVPKDRSVVYIANHRSYFDILLTYVRVPGPTGYIAKKEMLK